MARCKITTLLYFLVAILPATAYAQNKIGLNFGKGDSYRKARQAITEAGFIPVPFFSEGAECSFRDDVCGSYVEAVSCSGTGLGFCKFVFFHVKGRFFAEVITTGEDVDSLKVHDFKRASPEDQERYTDYANNIQERMQQKQRP